MVVAGRVEEREVAAGGVGWLHAVCVGVISSELGNCRADCGGVSVAVAFLLEWERECDGEGAVCAKTLEEPG